MRWSSERALHIAVLEELLIALKVDVRTQLSKNGAIGAPLSLLNRKRAS
jgi:hypothetical protein